MKRTCKRAMPLFVLLIAVGSGATKTNAETQSQVVWQSVAMACVPSASTVKTQSYITSAGGVKLKPNSSEPATFICPIAPSFELKRSGFLHLRVDYAEDNAVNPLSAIRAGLRGRSLKDPSRPDVASVYDVLVAVRIGCDVPERHYRRGAIYSFARPINFDFANNAYYVQFSLLRTGRSVEAVTLLRSDSEPPEIGNVISSCGSEACCDSRTIESREVCVSRRETGLCPASPPDSILFRNRP